MHRAGAARVRDSSTLKGFNVSKLEKMVHDKFERLLSRGYTRQNAVDRLLWVEFANIPAGIMARIVEGLPK
jgi:hypothetical protein